MTMKMTVFCQVCGTPRDESDPAAVYDKSAGEWRCADEAACGLRAVDAGGWCGQPEPVTGVGCQRFDGPHGGRLGHAAITVSGGKIIVKEW